MKTFNEYYYEKQCSEFLFSHNLSNEKLKEIETEVLDNLYNMMSIKEQKEWKEEHKILMNEVFPLVPVALFAGKKIASKIVSSLRGKSKDSEKNSEDEKINDKVEEKGGIVSLLYKAIKTLGVVAVAAALVFIGFQFDIIRDWLPFLTPFIDKVTDNIGSIAKEGFDKLLATFPLVASWFVSVIPNPFPAASRAVSDTFDLAADSAEDALTDAGLMNQGPSLKTWKAPKGLPSFIDPETGEMSFPVDTRTGLKHGDVINPRFRGDAPDLSGLADRLEPKANLTDILKKPKKLTPDEIKNNLDLLRSFK